MCFAVRYIQQIFVEFLPDDKHCMRCCVHKWKEVFPRVRELKNLVRMQVWDSATGAPLSDCSDEGVAKESVKQHYRLYSALKYVCVVLPSWDAERLSDLHKVMLMNDRQDGIQVQDFNSTVAWIADSWEGWIFRGDWHFGVLGELSNIVGNLGRGGKGWQRWTWKKIKRIMGKKERVGYKEAAEDKKKKKLLVKLVWFVVP